MRGQHCTAAELQVRIGEEGRLDALVGQGPRLTAVIVRYAPVDIATLTRSGSVDAATRCGSPDHRSRHPTPCDAGGPMGRGPARRSLPVGGLPRSDGSEAGVRRPLIATPAGSARPALRSRPPWGTRSNPPAARPRSSEVVGVETAGPQCSRPPENTRGRSPRVSSRPRTRPPISNCGTGPSRSTLGGSITPADPEPFLGSDQQYGPRTSLSSFSAVDPHHVDQRFPRRVALQLRAHQPGPPAARRPSRHRRGAG